MPTQMANLSGPLSVADVYDIAASIGKEFEKIIDSYGPETVTQLMPRVIYALEHLEILSTRDEKENEEITELKYAIERLQADKSAKAEDRDKYEKEIEQIEECWQNETKQMSAKVSHLEEDNRRMRVLLVEQQGTTNKIQKEAEVEDNKQTELIKELRDKTSQQRDELRILHRETRQKSTDIEALQSQLERLTRINADYRRKSTANRLQASKLLGDKAELQAQLLDKEKHLNEMCERLRDQASSSGDNSPTVTDSDTDMDKLQSQLHLQGKMVIDMADPDRPRFTLTELRDVLTERNELKTKVMELQEELQHYKPEPVEEPFDPDAPVQGPINKEPREKLFPEKYQNESGIRRFFKFLASPGTAKRRTKAAAASLGTPLRQL